MPQRKSRKERYVLYSHWGVGHGTRDIESWEGQNDGAEWLKNQPVYKHLAEAKKPLTALLERTEGLLVLFFDPGWKLALRPALDAAGQEELERAEAYASAVSHIVAGAFSTPRVRILTAKTLHEFIRGLRKRDRQKIHRWFVGEKEQATYDSPKIIEAFLRVRLLGSGIPVLRIDWDALINVENGRFLGLGLDDNAIRACLDRDGDERTDVLSRTWVCSAGYQLPNDETYEAWSRGFATRIQPALRATDEMCSLVGGFSFGLLSTPSDKLGKRRLDVDRITQGAFDLGLTKRYLGVEQRKGKWNTLAGRDSIATFGASPLAAVISGALLNLSPSAILDLPPFSNMTRGVMWIDDHLKFELHNALGHLRQDAHRTCRISTWVRKGRAAPTPNLAAYTWASYLPTLLLGLVMDAWIRKQPGEEAERPLVEALRDAITIGDLGHRTGMKLEKRLREVAIDRIAAVHRAWSALKDGDTHTLASAWATSEVRRLIEAQLPGVELVENSRGLGLVAEGRTEIRAISDLRPPIQDELRELIWDAVDYIHLTLHWPGMIQTIRAVERSLVKLSAV